MSERAAGRELDEQIEVRVFGKTLDVPRERAMAILGATYVRVTGPTFELDVHGQRVRMTMPNGESIPGHPSDDHFNQRYFRHVTAELLNYPNEIASIVERDLSRIRRVPKPYSTDIAAAWLVVDQMSAWEFGVWRDPNAITNPWRARFAVPLRKVGDEWRDPPAVYDAGAAIASHAICLAALAALGSSSGQGAAE